MKVSSHRQMQRSQRQSNPDNYEPDFLGKKGRRAILKKGKVKKNCRKWNKSKRYQKLAATKRESESRCSHSPVELIRSDSEKSSQIADFGMGEKLDIRL